MHIVELCILAHILVIPLPRSFKQERGWHSTCNDGMACAAMCIKKSITKTFFCGDEVFGDHWGKGHPGVAREPRRGKKWWGGLVW